MRGEDKHIVRFRRVLLAVKYIRSHSLHYLWLSSFHHAGAHQSPRGFGQPHLEAIMIIKQGSKPALGKGSIMNRQTYEATCESTLIGQSRRVQNRDSLYTGGVIGCKDGRFQVELFGHKVEWSRERCNPADGRDNPLGPPSNV
jgi:hypothetical protein